MPLTGPSVLVPVRNVRSDVSVYETTWASLNCSKLAAVARAATREDLICFRIGRFELLLASFLLADKGIWCRGWWWC